jgi:Histidine phosphatase superfamily (branch 1)
VALAYLVQHGEKEPVPGDPGLTPAGRQQASRTGRWLHRRGVQALYTSPLRRAWETADCIASVTGLAVQPDARLRERLNWDGSQPYEAFLALWARTTSDRDFVAPGGGSSRQAGTRLQAFLAGLPSRSGPVVVITPRRNHCRSAAQPPRGPRPASAAAHRRHPAMRHHHDRRPGRRHDRFDRTPLTSLPGTVAHIRPPFHLARPAA